MKNRICYVACAVAIAICCLLSDQNIFYYLLLLYALLTIVLAAMAAMGGRKIIIQMENRQSAIQDENFPFVLKIQNNSKIPVFLASCLIRSDNLLTGESECREVFFSIKSKKENTVMLEGRSDFCGKCQIFVGRMVHSDPFGIFSFPRKTKANGCITVLPRFSPIMLPASEGMSVFDLESVQYSAEKSGMDVNEMFGIRPYQSGDALGRIHWKLSGKLDGIMVKVPSFPVDSTVLVLLENLIFPEKGYQNSAAAEVAASLSWSLLDAGINHMFCYFSHAAGTFEFCCMENQVQLQETLVQLAEDIVQRGALGQADRNTVAFLQEKVDEYGCLFSISASSESVLPQGFYRSDRHRYLLCCKEDGVSDGDFRDGRIAFPPVKWNEALRSLNI